MRSRFAHVFLILLGFSEYVLFTAYGRNKRWQARNTNTFSSAHATSALAKSVVQLNVKAEK